VTEPNLVRQRCIEIVRQIPMLPHADPRTAAKLDLGAQFSLEFALAWRRGKQRIQIAQAISTKPNPPRKLQPDNQTHQRSGSSCQSQKEVAKGKVESAAIVDDQLHSNEYSDH
jgi:hypothetical protein